MAEEVVISNLGFVVEKLLNPIGRQFGYLFYYKKIVENLEDQVKALENMRDDVNRSVDVVKAKLQVVGRDVEDWMNNVEEIKSNVTGVVDDKDKVEKGCCNGWCPNLKQRYLLGRKARKHTDILVKLQETGNKFTKFAYPPAPMSMTTPSTIGSEVYKSRISKTKEVLELLKNEHICMIGVCDLGGVGKTTMANKVHQKAMEENLFDEVVMAVVSQNKDITVQGHLADMLGLKFDENTSRLARAEQLHSRLSNGKRILVILDDVWEEIDLKGLGLPVGGKGDCKGCKVMLTSRSKDVCCKMGTQEIIQIQVLSAEEAWDLFKENAGECVMETDICSIAQEVASECGGLPLVTVGRALKPRKEKDAWEDALQQLKRSAVTTIPGMHEKVYSSLALSYKLLASVQTQSMLLLCCLFPEDYDIPIEDLFRYGEGLRFFKNVQTLAETRNRVRSLVYELRSCYLLLPSDREGYVKMHDVIRDFGLWFASNGDHAFMVRHEFGLKEWPQSDANEAYTSISLSSEEQLKRPVGMDFSRLKLLRLFAKGPLQILGDYFGDMKELNVIHFTDVFGGFVSESISVEFPPTTLPYLMKLQTLCLDHCRFGSDLAFIGSLKNLRILSFYECCIDVLPSEIGQLSNLKLLDLRCAHLGLIPSGVLSCLKKLEELYMGKYFDRYGVEECNRGHCARITELNSLSCLKTLEICLYGPDHLLQLRDSILENLTRFDLLIYDGTIKLRSYEVANRVKFQQIGASILLETKLNGLMRRTGELNLTEIIGLRHIVKDSRNVDFRELKRLEIRDCRDLMGISDGYLPAGSFANLQEASLVELPALRQLWGCPIQPPCLSNLRVLKVSCCDAIKTLFPQSAVECLVQLEELECYSCKLLEGIVSRRAEDENCAEIIEFPKLKYLYIMWLESLKSFVLGSENNHASIQSLFNEVMLPSIGKLHLSDVDSVVQIVGGEIEAGSFDKLRFLEIESCNKLVCVATSDTIQLLPNLEDLRVRFCDSVVTVFDFERIQVSREHAQGMLGQLRSINLLQLSQLTHIWKMVPKEIKSFKNLQSLMVWGCNSLRYLFSPSVARLLANIREIRLGDCGKMKVVMRTEEEEDCFSEIEKVDKLDFPKLRFLEIEDLGNLTMFCSGNHDIEFLSLESVVIECCPKMKNFSSGPLNAPMLKRVGRGFGDWVWMDDLNSTMRYIDEIEAHVRMKNFRSGTLIAPNLGRVYAGKM